MENRIGNSDGAAIPKKSRSLDLKSLYKSRFSMESQKNMGLKRKNSLEAGGDDERSKKRSKTVSISSLKNVDNNKRSVDEVYKDGVSSSSHHPKDVKLGLSHKLDNGSGCNGILFSFDDSGIQIPKRKRDFVRRKKGEVSQVLTPPVQSCSKEDPINQVARDDSVTGVESSKDLVPQVESSKDLVPQVESSKDKQKKSFDDFKENRMGLPNSARHLKGEAGHARHSAVNKGESSLKKENRNRYVESSLKKENRNGESSLKKENRKGESSLKKENKNDESSLKKENRNGESSLKNEIRNSKSNSNRHLKGEEVRHASYSVTNGDSSLKTSSGISDSNSAQCLKEDEGAARHSGVNNSDSSLKKSRRNKSKRKDSRQSSICVAKDAESLIDTSVKVCEDLLEDDLEENAAMMLSSRFNPSCTGFSSTSKSIASTNGLSFLLSPVRDFGSPRSDSALFDAAGRALRPRTQHKEGGPSRKRRHYYEIVSGDLDVYWVLNRRIKVFWPLDQCWYYGLVNDYDEERKLHHVKYDDRDEEWINLENESFKLLLLPSEVPGRAARRRSRIREKCSDERRGSLKPSKDNKERNLTTEIDNRMINHVDSEPIISWFSRSTGLVKSSSFEPIKKQKTSDISMTIEPTLLSDGAVKARALPDSFSDGGRAGESTSESPTCSKGTKLPVVYYRRRFRKKGSASCLVSAVNDVSSSRPASATLLTPLVDQSGLEEHDISRKRLDSDGVLWSTDIARLLELTIPLIDSRQIRFELSFPVISVLNYAFGAENLWLFRAVFLLHYGTLMPTCPRVRLEMLFVDNIVGLRFFLFEGCLKQAVAYVFLVLTLFHRPNVHDKYADSQLPVTSIRFNFSCIQDLRKQFVFAFYNFAEVKNSMWMCLDSKLKRRHCLLTRQLPLSQCTYENIKAFQNGCNQLSTTSICRDESSTKGLQRRPRQGISLMGVSRDSTYVKLSQLSSDSDKKQRKFPPFALSFTAAPTFFLSLHLKLLMEQSVAHISFGDHGSVERPESPGSLTGDCCSSLEHFSNRGSESSLENNVSECTLENAVKDVSKDAASDGCLSVAKQKLKAVGHSVCSGGNWIRSPEKFDNGDQNVAGTSGSSHDPEDIGSEAIVPMQKWRCQDSGLEQSVLSPRPSVDRDKTDARPPPLNGIRVEIPTFDSFEKNVDREFHSAQRSTDLSWNMNGGIIPSPNPTAPRSTWHRNRSSSSSFGYLTQGWSDGKAEIVHNTFGNGPKKPRTQVSYSLPFGGFDYGLKNRGHHQKGLPHTRIRRANEKRLSDVSRGSQKNLELLSCNANVLITVRDKGWRECGAQIVLELFDHNEWKLAVKLSGSTRFSYKAHQFLQPGSTNRFTHAMMWKGGKDWTLEFLDRSQWALFKEMHEECYNRNMRAALIKNIPIPGVRLIEEADDNGSEVAFVRSSKYFRQVESDLEMALDPLHILYDMDSDDERLILKVRNSSEAETSCMNEVSEELFEKTMDMFEKAAYSQQRDQFTSDEIEELMGGIGSLEAIKIIHEHWRQKRQKKGMPLIRHLQPPLWKRYQQQVREWELGMSKINTTHTLPNGCQEKVAQIEKPPMFAFCLKPRGLEVPNKGSKQRSHRRISISGKNNTVIGDHDGFHTFGRRLNGFAFGDEKVLYPGHNYESLDDSPRIFSPRVISPHDAGNMGYFSMNSDGFDRNQYQKFQRSKSKKFGMFESSYDAQMMASYNQRLIGKRNGNYRWNMGYSEWPSQRHIYSDGPQRHGGEQFDSSDLGDEFKLRDASGIAQHASNVAKLKREKAQKMLYRADIAIHKAVAALMIADAVKAAASSDDVSSDE